MNDMTVAIAVKAQPVTLDFFFLCDTPGAYFVIDPIAGVSILAAIHNLGLSVRIAVFQGIAVADTDVGQITTLTFCTVVTVVLLIRHAGFVTSAAVSLFQSTDITPFQYVSVTLT